MATREGARRQYVVVLEQTPYNWAAYVPDVPGCIATAKTRVGVERVIREALELHLEGMPELPQPGTWTTVVDVAARPTRRARAKNAS